ncbi:MAG: squalene synthase HpnC [Solirubrobacteraceae bacterium]|nr:MAG: squalene synthase HpnC [Solirubrobacterales bacterium]
MAQAAAENFPVASRLLPRRARGHLLALYGFARLVDDIGDESIGDPRPALDWLEQELAHAFAGRAEHPLMRRLEATIKECSLPIAPFTRLIAANRQDQRIKRYETWEQLLAYCELSANPVGELVLGVFGLATAERIALSDAVCSALQVVEHLQDVGEDAARDRVYLPAADLARFGCELAELHARETSPALARVVGLQAERTRGLLLEGGRLVATLRGRPRLAVAAFVAGGRAALEAIERADCAVLPSAPRPTRVRRATALLTTLAGARRR